MKKLLSLAVAAAFVAPLVASAQPTVYGRVNQNLVWSDPDGGSDEWDLEDNASRFGVKGSEDLGNGLKAIYQFEWFVDSENTGDVGSTPNARGRLAYAGLAGNWGTVALGKQWSPYYGSVAKADIFQTNSVDDVYLGPYRLGNAVSYISPDFGGLSFKAALIVSDEDSAGPLCHPDSCTGTGEDFLDHYNVSVDYDNGPLSVGVSYISAQGDTIDGDTWGIGGKWNFGMFAVIGQYESGDWPALGDDLDAWVVAGEMYLGNNTIRAKYGNVDNGDDYDQWAIGFQHAMSKRTRVFAEYEDSDLNFGRDGGSRLGLGVRHDF